MANKSQDPQPKTVHEAIEGMAPRLNPDVAGDLQATIQFKVSPSTSLETGGDYYLSIADGKCGFSTGLASDPTLTISTPADVWLKISRKEMNGSLALLTGKYKAQGKMGLLMKMDKLFSGQSPEVEVAEKG
ncbi:MAG TPA: SCP2 sterol-binding domain-containing protein [Anaerolineales bacterium]|nr:SCP2 sterol-binding domain-containing protein [Anaerolineales bacterium]